MRRNDKLPLAMTKKSLVVYIVSIVLIGLFLFFVRGEWHEKYVTYLNEHPFGKPKYQSMKMDLLKRFQRREYLVKKSDAFL